MGKFSKHHTKWTLAECTPWLECSEMNVCRNIGTFSARVQSRNTPRVTSLALAREPRPRSCTDDPGSAPMGPGPV